MSFEEITSLRNNIITLIKGSKIYAAINGIRSLIAEDESWDLTDELDRIETSYKYMIQYFVAGTVDNQQERILCEIVESLYAKVPLGVFFPAFVAFGEEPLFHAPYVVLSGAYMIYKYIK